MHIQKLLKEKRDLEDKFFGSKTEYSLEVIIIIFKR